MPIGSYIDKKQRHERLIGLLKSDSHWSTSQLSAELDVSQRTLMRDLNELIESGIPIETDRGRGGGVRINERYGLGRLNLNYAEILDLLIALSVAQKMSSSIFLNNIKSIKDKISISLPDSYHKIVKKFRTRIYVGQPASKEVLGSIEKTRCDFSKINQSFFESKTLTITYKNAKGELKIRNIEPHYMLLNPPIWYIFAWDCEVNEIKYFRFDRIKEVEVLSKTFNLHHKDDFLNEINKHFKNI